MSDSIKNDLGRIGLVTDGAGALSATSLTASGAGTFGSLTVGGIPVGTEAATALATVGNGTVTAAIIKSRNCIRGGAQSGSAFTDTTDTATLIVAALTSYVVGEAFKFTYVNNTNATATLAGGTGVNSAGTIAVIPAFSQVQFLVVITSATAVTFTLLLDGNKSILPPEAAGTLATNGAGTLTAALIVNRQVTRTTVAAAFIDTTDTAANIFAAVPNAVAGESFEFSYTNSTSAACTLTGGTGVNSAGVIAVIPALSTARLLIVLTSATVVTFTVQSISQQAIVQGAVGTLATNGAGTVLAATIAGQVLNRTTVAANFTDTTDTAALIVAAVPNAAVGQSFIFTYLNSVNYVCTLVGGTGVNSAGTIGLIPAQTAARYLVTLTSLSVVTFTLLGLTALAAQPPIAGGSAVTVTAANNGQVVKLDTAGGTVVTLPAATGTGNTFYCIVTTSTTSNAHKILTVGTDYIIGNAYGYTGSTAKVFGSPASTNRSIQMPFAGSQPSGGLIGDIFTFKDVGTALWHCEGFYSAGTTPTTPYSSATS